MGNLILRSSYFSDGGEIPRECGYKNENTQPPLQIRGIPDEAVELALIMDDPDAMGAVGKVWVHWVVWNLQRNTEFLPGDDSMNGREGMTDFGEVGYGGPAPPDKRHTYVFKLYALNCTTEHQLGPGISTKADLEKVMEGHIIAEAKLTGTYAP